MEPRLVVLLALATAAIAGPITIHETTYSCALECPPTSKYNYAPGTTYMYDYRVDTETSMSGASEDSAKLTLTARAEIEVLSPCEMALSLRDTRLFHSDVSGGLRAADREDTIRRGLETSALRFSFQDGAVDHVCPGDRQEAWALNVKKGVLSAFQNSMDNIIQAQNVTETDVAGTCKTEYQVTSNGYYNVDVTKTKDILTCTDRHDYRTMVQMVPYTVPSEIQSLPLMKTSHECTQVIQKGGVFQSSICKESHVYRPFSNGQDGGSTNVVQTLTYKTYRTDVTSTEGAIYSRDSLVYDHSANRPSTEQARHHTEQKLKEICDSTAYDVKPESPRLFSELVATLKALDKETMQEILTKLKSKGLCPSNDKAFKSYLDALPATGTSASVSVMVSLISEGEIKDLQAKAWIVSLAFIQAPTNDMLLDVKQLIDSDKFREDALLPVSSMMNNLCSKQADCDQSYAAMSIMTSLENNLGYSCDASGKDFTQILLTLRAIGNAGNSNRAVPTVNKCLAAESNPLEVRVAAAGAFRRLPCDADTTTLWQIYNNAEVDSELRISAYLALIRCPSDVTLSKMVTSLDNEVDAQVGAFVYSHLTNLRESSDPHKQDAARALDNLVIPSKFESNPLKASTNMEASALLNKINTGFVAESNLVWSSDTQMPRSASANLTVELFGQSVNLVDFGGRLEGLEYLIKNLLGPRMGGKDWTGDKDVSGSIYGRLFGNEMVFVHSEQMKKDVKLSKQWMNMIKALSKKQDFSFTHSAQIINARMIIPTVAGLPINIDVNGSAVVDLVLSGKADLRRMGRTPMSLDIDGEIRPSAALEITGTMSVDAFVTKTGLRMRNTLHTSTSLKGRIQVEGGELLNVELDSPKDNIEIFDARSRFFIVHNDVEQEQNMITANRREFEQCSSNKLADITGAILCGQVSYPNASMQVEGPYFPLTGPSSASLVLRKTDTHSGYKLLAKRVVNKRMSNAQISFNTPGSRVDRVILIDMTMNIPTKSVDAQMITPWKKAAFAGSFINKADLKSVSGSLTVDESNVYGIISEVKISQSKRKLHLSPMVEIRRPGMDTIQLSGFVSEERGLKGIDVDLSLSGLRKLPYNIKASVSNTKKEKSVKASISDDGDKTRYGFEALSHLSVAGKKISVFRSTNSLKVSSPKRELVNVEATMDYKEDKSLKLDGTVDVHRLMKRPASIKVDIAKSAKKRSSRYDINANIKSTAMTGRVDSVFNFKDSRIMSTKTIVDYTIPKVAKNRITYTGKYSDRSTKAYTKYTVKSNLEVKKNPEYNLGIDFGFDNKKKHSEADLEIKYGPDFKNKDKTITLGYALNRKIPNYKNAFVNYKLKAEAPEHNVKIQVSGKHEHNPNTIDSDVVLRVGKDQTVKANVFLKDRSNKQAKLNGRATISWPGAEYTLSSKLDQKSAKHFTHEIQLKEKDGTKHSIESVYKRSGSHVFSTEIKLKGLKKVVLSGSANLRGKTPHASAEVKYGKDTYGLSTKAKQSKNVGGVVIVEMVHPERRVLVKVVGEKAQYKIDGRVEASWDADKDKSKKMILDGSVYKKNAGVSISLGGDVSFTSPFEKFENLAGSVKYGNDRAQHDINGKISWGGKHKQATANLSLKKPVSLSYLVGTVEAKTPFKMMRTASAELEHTWDDALRTTIKGNLNKEKAELVVQGQGKLNNLDGSASFSSTIKNAEDISGSLTHKVTSGKIESRATLKHNRNSYGYDLNMEHLAEYWVIKNSGDLTLTAPKSKASTSWQYRLGENDMQSTISSQWGKKRINVQLTGSHDLSSVRAINGELKIESPWKKIGDVIVTVNHKHSEGMINSKSVLIQNRKTKALADVQYARTSGKTDFNVEIQSPFSEDLNGKLNANYGAFPMTSDVSVQWHPRKRITAESSLSAGNWDDASFDLKLSTPIKDFRTITIKASNKKDGAEVVSHANLDYGARKNVDLETRFSLEDLSKLARVRLTTPFDSIKSLETGLRFDGQAANFDSSADFELMPLVGKFQGSANWRHDRDITGSLRVDTPFADYPFFELSGYSNDKAKARKSRVEVKLHPRQVYSLDALYALDMPISFEATVNSPHPEYDNLAVVLQHNHSPSSVASHGELRYQADKTIQADLNAVWDSNVQGSLIVKTPFSGFESSKLALTHQGPLDDFSSHSEIHVAEKSVVADASFKSGYTTNGRLTLSSPIPGMESINLNIMKKGKAKNFKGELTLDVNDKKIDADYQHKLTKQGLKGSFKLATPYTDNIKLNLDHNGMLKKFTNEISANYGRKYQINSDISYEHSHPVMTGQGTIKCKLGRRRNVARVSFNRNGELEDVTIRGTAAYNDDEISVDGSWKHKNGVEGNVQINTPFDGFRTTGITVSHAGSINNFRSNAGVTYMDGKSINGKINLSNNGLKHVNLDSEITTPFEQFPSASISFNHNHDERANIINGEATLTTPVADFGSGSVTYDKVGGIDNLVLTTTAKKYGRQVASLKLTNSVEDQELHSKLETELSEYPDLSLSFDHLGDIRNSFNTKASANLGEEKIFGEIAKQGAIDDVAVNGRAGYNSDAVEITGTWNSQRGIDGNLEIKTPFDNFSDLGMSISHAGDMSDFTSSASVEYMDDKIISGKVELSAGDSVRFATELNTPFEGFEHTRLETNGAYDAYTKDVNAKIVLTSNINAYGTGEASLSKSGSLDNLVVDGRILRNNVELGNVQITNTQSGKDINSAFNLRGNDFPEVDATVVHSGDLSNFETKARASVDNKEIFVNELSLNMRDQEINAEAILRYDIDIIGSNQGSLRLEKEGELDNVKINVIGNLNGDRYVIDGKMQLKSDKTGSLTINTPIQGYTNVGVSFSHSGDLKAFVSEGKINLLDGDDYSAKVDFSGSNLRLISTAVEIGTPIEGAEFTKFNYQHNGQEDSFKCLATLEYGQSNKITYDMSASLNQILDFNVIIKTPFDNYEDLMASATVEKTWPKLSIKSKLNAGNGLNFLIDGSMDATKDITGRLAVNTPFDGFNNVGLSFDHEGKMKNFKTKGSLTYMDDKEISGKIIFKLRRSFLSAELKTPFVGYENTEYEFSHSSTKRECTTTTKLVYGDGNVVSAEAVTTFKPKPGFALTVKSPVPNYEVLTASASVDNSWPKLELNSKVSSGIDRQVTFDASFDATNDISGSVEIKTPVEGFTNVGLSFQHSGNTDKFDSEGKVTYKDGNDIVGKVSFYKYMWRRLMATVELSTPFDGAENSKAVVTYEDNSNSISTAASLEYANGQKMDGNMKLTYSPSYEALLTINTPFDYYNEIRARGSLDITAPSYSVGYSVNYGENSLYSANGKLNLNSADNVDGSLEIVLSIEGIEFTKAEYQHTLDSHRVDGSLSLTYGRGKIISGDVKATKVPNYDATVTVKTPFVGYENMQASANYDNSYDKYEASSSLSLGSGYLFSVASGLDISAEPIRATVQLSTPYTDYRNMELALTKQGQLNDFHVTGFLTSPLTDSINAEANLKYNSPSDMEALASIKSSFVGMDDLVAEMKNSDVSGEKKTHAVVGWTSGQQIVLDGLFRNQQGWYENKIVGDLSLSTPFIAVRSLSAQLEHTGKSDVSSQVVNFELNGDKLLDMDTEFSSNAQHMATVTFRKPESMKYSLVASNKDGLSEAELEANWDRNTIDSSVRVLASVNDKSDSYKTERSVDISLEHASRKVGLVHELSSSRKDASSSGKIYWDSDDSSKVFYDLQLKDSNRRRKEIIDGHFIVGLPSRTLKLAGSCSDNKVNKIADVVFSWDADSTDKQVGLKATMANGDRVKGDITLSMPGITQEIRVDGEIMPQNGHITLDSKTDILFSQNARKTLTLTSKLEGTSDYINNYNYSLAVGVSHPPTNVDIQMNSHLGSSDEKMTVGVSTDYLTARRQNKNFGLLAEINKLKKEISLLITDPVSMKQVEVVGNVVSESPYKVRMVNKIDGVESFRSDLTVDENKKAIQLELTEGSEGISLWAGYPNNTAFRGQMRRISYGQEMTEALLAVRLNTTRLMHTRLHWNPELIQEIRQAVKSRAINGGIMAAETLAEFNAAVADELAAKYSAITGFINEELAPTLDSLDKELRQVADGMTKVAREMRKILRTKELVGPWRIMKMLEVTLTSFTKEFRQTSNDLVRQLKQDLQDMTAYPIKAKYTWLASGSEAWINKQAQKALANIESYLAKVEAALAQYYEKISQAKQDTKDSVYNATYVTFISDRLGDIDVSDYVPSIEIPKQYRTAIYNANDAITTRLGDVLDAPGLHYVKGGVNEVYQQGLWAYNYWQIEKNLDSRLEEISKLIQEIVKEELKEYVPELNPITVWDPEHGEIQADLPLPLDVARLDELPDLSPLADKIVVYLPDASTLDNFYGYVPNVWTNKTTQEEVALRKYHSARSPRKNWSRRASRQ